METPAAAPETAEPENTEEKQYLDLIRHILTHGETRRDRTGTGTVAVFAPPQMRFTLADMTLPLLTTKRVFWRGVAEELLWFLRGSTDANELAARNVHIWAGNGTREFLDSVGLTENRAGDLGPVYGFQWRHFGAEYRGADCSYEGKGVDQLAQVIEKIRSNPTDRRIIMSAWNPAALKDMALPPCHMFCQFFVSLSQSGAPPRLSCLLYQRSADMGLGVPFNIASYALLTHLLAHVTGCVADTFVHTLGDAHVYLDHCEPLETQQLGRVPRPFPKLRITKPLHASKQTAAELTTAECISWLESLTLDDLVVDGYRPHPKIEMRMSV